MYARVVLVYHIHIYTNKGIQIHFIMVTQSRSCGHHEFERMYQLASIYSFNIQICSCACELEITNTSTKEIRMFNISDLLHILLI